MAEEYFSKNLDHLGIVATICDEINLIGIVDQLIPPDPRMMLTTGECVKLARLFEAMRVVNNNFICDCC